MRSILAACVAFGAITVAALPPAHAEVRIGVPGLHVDVGPHPHYHHYWEHRHWEARREGCYYHGCWR
jgi:hypothetical protein